MLAPYSHQSQLNIINMTALYPCTLECPGMMHVLDHQSQLAGKGTWLVMCHCRQGSQCPAINPTTAESSRLNTNDTPWP